MSVRDKPNDWCDATRFVLNDHSVAVPEEGLMFAGVRRVWRYATGEMGVQRWLVWLAVGGAWINVVRWFA